MGNVSRFDPFPGVRFSPGLDPAVVTAPPYDVVDDHDRQALVDGHDRNCVVIDIPLESSGEGRYADARRTLEAWLADGTLGRDDEPSFTVYRMDFRDDAGRPASTLGVIGAVELSAPGEGWILPHEHTTPKARTDRLDLIRATRANLSPVWMLSLAKGLTDVIRTDEPPLASWTDGDGVTHSVWRLDEPGQVAAISAAVGDAPLIVADGHHRYETSLTYRDEQRSAGDHSADAMMALAVELAPDQLCVRPIHRLVSGVSRDDLVGALCGDAFTVVGDPVAAAAVADGSVLDRMASAGALAVVAPDGNAVLLAPRPEAFADIADLDSARLAHVLHSVPTASVTYQHGTSLVYRAVLAGEAEAGVLLRPAPVAQIEANAHSGERMPPKTTFFHPKPRTGVVFRTL